VATSLNLNVPGTTTVAAYLHLLATPAEDREGDSVVPRVVHQLVLSADQTVPDAVSTIKLAELTRGLDGAWQPSPNYLPPMLLVGATPFLQKDLTELQAGLEAFQYRVMMDSVSYLSGSSQAMVKQCLKSIHRMRRMLANIKAGIQLHPYQLYEAIKELYVEVCLYHDAAPQHADEPYNHEQLGPVLRRAIGPLNEQMRGAQKSAPYAAFGLRDGVFRLDLPRAVHKARELYFLIQKSQAQREVTLNEFKLASPSRLMMTHRLSLPGIGLTKADRPMLAHSFGSEVEFFYVQRGEEWEHALRDGAIAFYARPELGDLEFYLYWSAA